MLPARLIDALPPSVRVVEVGVGGRFEVLEALADERADLALVATDIDARRLEGAPSGVEVHVDDVTAPSTGIYAEAALLYTIRCPAELQVPLARLAREVDARLAIRPLKDEWAHLDGILGAHQLRSTPGGAWRIWPPLDG